MMKTARFLYLFAAVCVGASMLISCKNKTVVKENPFFVPWDTLFGVPPFDRIETKHYIPAFEAGMEAEVAEIDSIVHNPAAPDFRNTILAFDNAGADLKRVSLVFFALNSAETNDEMQKIQQKITPLLSQHADRIMLNDALFQRIKSVYDSRDSVPLDADRLRLLEKTYRRFVRSGALLSEEQKDELKEINEKLSMLSVAFGNNLLYDTKNFILVVDSSQTGGLPSSLLTAAHEKAVERGKHGKWIFTLDNASMIPFLQNSTHRELREEIRRAYLDRCNHGGKTDNKQIVNDIVNLRTRRAALIGYATHADYVLEEMVAKKPENVYALLDELWVPALRRTMDELSEMRKMKMEQSGSEDFASWDWWFYAEKVRKKRYNLDEETLRPYFSLENVRNGIFSLSNRLYGVTFRPVVLPVYHPEVKTYEVLDKDNSHLGILYLDFFPRDGKRAGAWCGRFRGQSYDANGNRVAPIVTIVCNFTRPSGRRPALLTLDETETFFHEFGHALHSLFSDVKYQGLTGVERDFVELPSQIMENWAFEPEMLSKYAFHYQNNKPIPDDLIQKIRNSALFNQGFATLEYLAAAYSDMDIHHLAEFTELDLNAFERQILNEQRGLIPEVEPRYRFPFFAHIFNGGYSAGYYSYIWSEVLDKDAYQAFVETGDIFNRDVATRFRDEILSRGGTADGMTLYENFRGQEPSRLPLLRARGLIADEPKPVPEAETTN